jgi:hypothetical protein
VPDRFAEWYKLNLIAFDTHHHALLIVRECFNSGDSQTACKNPVKSGRRSSTLDIPRDSDSYIILRVILFNLFGYCQGVAYLFSFCYKDYRGFFALTCFLIRRILTASRLNWIL